MAIAEKLAVLLNDRQQEQFNITGFATSIGRADANDYTLDADMLLSKQHAFILYLKGKFIIQDVGSTNGTYLNGKRLACLQPYILKFGDEIIVGSTRLIFVDMAGPCAADGSPTHNLDQQVQCIQEYEPGCIWNNPGFSDEYDEKPMESIFVLEAVSDSVHRANQ